MGLRPFTPRAVHWTAHRFANLRSLPREHWSQTASTNPLERVIREIKRCTDVIGIFPNDDAIIPDRRGRDKADLPRDPQLRKGGPQCPRMVCRPQSVRHNVRRALRRLSRSRSWATGLPTIFERPTTTAFNPDSDPKWSRSIFRQPSGVQGTMASCPVPRSPTFEMWNPSKCFCWVDRVNYQATVQMVR